MGQCCCTESNYNGDFDVIDQFRVWDDVFFGVLSQHIAKLKQNLLDGD